MGTSLDVTLEELRQRRGSKWTSFDADVLPAWVADMDFPIAEPVREAILAVVARNDGGYPVVIQTPIYPPFLQLVEKLGRRVVANPLLAGPDRYASPVRS